MKPLFPQPIGTLRDLGTPREWLSEAVCLALCAVLILAAWILL